MNRLKYFMVLTCLCSAIPIIKAQHWSVKTNALYDAVGALNISSEVGLSSRLTLLAGGSYTPFKYTKTTFLKQWTADLEARYWLCQKFYGSFWGAHIIGGEYNSQLSVISKDLQYEGRAIGAGVSYGYQWILSSRWALEATVGVGYLNFSSRTYECGTCGDYKGKKKFNYWGPTKVGVSFVYFLK